jgi:dihydrofolate reductase
MTRTVYYTATSLDGFIATDDHSLDWLFSRESDADGPMG